MNQAQVCWNDKKNKVDRTRTKIRIRKYLFRGKLEGYIWLQYR